MATIVGILKHFVPLTDLIELIVQYACHYAVGCTLCDKERCYYETRRTPSIHIYGDVQWVCDFCFEESGICGAFLCEEQSKRCCFKLSICFFCERIMNEHMKASVRSFTCPFDMCCFCQRRFSLMMHCQ